MSPISKPSPATAISLVALFVALGGTGLAASRLPRNSVGSAQVINGSLQTSDLSSGAVSSLKGKSGAQGPQGAQGSTGTQGPQGASGPQGQQGAAGPQGATGPQGVQGASGSPGVAGRDGAAIAARVRSSDTVFTPTNGAQIEIPLTGKAWTQEVTDLDELPFGELTYTAPTSDSCGATGFALLSLEITVGGRSFFTQVTSLRDGGTRTATLGAPGYFFEPAAPTARSATAMVSSGCDSVSLHPSFVIHDLRFDVLRAS